MKKKKTILWAALIIIACIGIGVGISLLDFSHKHSFGEWETLTPAGCESAQIEVRRCECGEEETREGEPATGHDFVSISAQSLMETPMATMEVTAEDLRVTGTCECGSEIPITEGIEVEGGSLVLGENTVTVHWGALSATLTIQATELDLALEGVISDDTYVFSGTRDSEHSGKKELGTKSDQYRIYYRVNLSQILNSALFEVNRDNAKVKLILAITSGSVSDDTVFTLKAYAPDLPETGAAFSDLTWNSVDNKEGTAGPYANLHWSSGTTLVSGTAGHHICVEDGRITVTLAYSQIADFMDENGNILFAFGANAEELKVGSLENKTEANKPVFQVILNDAHFHVFDRETAAEQYFVSANCTERAKYLKSCTCGEAGTEVFEYGEVIGHTYGPLVAGKAKTCTADGMKAHYRCTACGKYFVEKDGKKTAINLESLKISACHEYKLIPAKAATCTSSGNHKYYKCADCGKYFDADKKETTKEAQKIPAGHTYSGLVPRVEATCTEDGMKEHYRCTVCGKYFLEKDGKKTAVNAASLKISAGHDMVMKWDDTHHWTECARGCGEETDHEAHHGGTATDTEKAKCEVCGQPYGELKAGAARRGYVICLK